MKGMKKILCLVLALLIFAGMALGSGSSSEDGEKDIVGGDNGEQAVAITIEEQILLDRDGIKVTAKEYVEDSIWGDGIKVLVENNSDKNLGIGCDALIVNNYMITDLFSCNVAAGKKANDTIYLSSSALEAAGIDNVGQIELYLRVFDADTYQNVFNADPVTIKTSAFANMDTTANDVGTELYNKDGIKIVGKFVEENSFWGTAVLLYMENTTGQNVTVSCDNVSVNGFMVTPLFYSSIYAGKMAVDEITILSSDLENNGITSVDEVELSFRIRNSDTYEKIAETDPIKFSTK